MRVDERRDFLGRGEWFFAVFVFWVGDADDVVEGDDHVFEVEDVGEVEPGAFDGGDVYVGGEFGVGEGCDVAWFETSFVPFEVVAWAVAAPGA